MLKQAAKYCRASRSAVMRHGLRLCLAQATTELERACREGRKPDFTPVRQRGRPGDRAIHPSRPGFKEQATSL
jgi:hypothetical protein